MKRLLVEANLNKYIRSKNNICSKCVFNVANPPSLTTQLTEKRYQLETGWELLQTVTTLSHAVRPVISPRKHQKPTFEARCGGTRL